MPELMNEIMTDLINDLYAGNDLSFENSTALFEEMLSGEMDPIIISSILTALKTKGEASSEIAGLVKTMRKGAKTIGTPQSSIYADCCGTGGDGFNTFNVSTASAFVAATCGLSMVKHGNRSVSSKFGSADIIEAIGIDLASTAEKTKQCLDLHDFCFLFAPAYHPLMAHVVPVRKKLATSTIFNLAGPLANPAAPPVQLMGVCREELCKPLAEVLLQLNCKRALVVYGAGLDEIALHDKTTAVMVDDGSIVEMELTPEDAGLERQPLEAIQLNDEDPVQLFLDVLSGNGSKAMTDVVALNTGTLLWLAGNYDSIKLATSIAKKAILEGAVAEKVKAIQDFYQS